MPKYTLLLGAEGCSELADEPWLRDATDDEIEAVLEANEKHPGLIDFIGRPYWWKTVTEEAPEWALEAARTHLRMVRLNP